MEAQYYFDVPDNQLDAFLEHIVEGIYGVKRIDCIITTIRIGSNRIELKTDPQIPLFNSLPITIVDDSSMTNYSIHELVNVVGEKIKNAVMDFSHPIGTYYPVTSKITLSGDELTLIIKQLARDGVITKFFGLDDINNSRFIVYVKSYKIATIVKIVDKTLVITIYNLLRSMFDVDDGYSNTLDTLGKLNNNWRKWKIARNLSIPIHPPNYV